MTAGAAMFHEPPTPSAPPAFGSALDALTPELAALDGRALVTLNADSTSVFLTVLGTMPALERLRPELTRTFGETAAAAVDRLPVLAHALLQAHARWLVAEPGDEMEALVRQVRDERRLLWAELRALRADKRVSPKELPPLRGGNPRGLALDLLDLSMFLRVRSSSWGGVMRLSTVDLDRAEASAGRLLQAVATRARPGPSPARELRTRAFTLLFRTYDEVRRMVSFVRWREGDATDLVPGWTRPVRTALRGARPAAGSFSRAAGNARGGLTTPGPTPMKST